MLLAVSLAVASYGRGGHHRLALAGFSTGSGDDDNACDSAPTLAELAARAPHDGEHVFCDETQSMYRFDPTATANDGFVYVAPTSSAGPGRWVHEGDDLLLTAIDGATDDWPRLLTALNATANANKRLVLSSTKPWTCNTAPGQGLLAGVYVPSHARLFCQPGVVIRSTLVPTGSVGDFWQSPFLALAKPLAINGALASAAAQGATQISVSMPAPSPGVWLAIENEKITNVSEMHKVISVAGTGSPYLVTLDEPLDTSWPAAGSIVQAFDLAENIDLDFNGAEISGTGDRVIELAAVVHSRVRNLRITPKYGNFVWGGSFDVGGRYNTWEGCSVDGTSGVGLALENNHGSRIVHSQADNIVTGTGFYIPDCFGCTLEESTANGANIGAFLGPDGTNDYSASIGTRITGLTATGSKSFGVLVIGGSSTVIENSAVLQGGYGIEVAAGEGGVTGDAKLRNTLIEGTLQDALVVSASTVAAQGVTLKDVGGYGIHTGGAGTVLSMTGISFAQAKAGGGPWYLEGAGKTTIRDFDSNAAFDGTWLGVAATPTAELHLENGTMTANGTGLKAVLDMEAGATVYLDQVRTAGDGYPFGVYAAHGNGARVIRGTAVDLSSCTNPYVFDASAFANFGTVTVNGANPIALQSPMPLYQSGQTMSVALQSIAGVPGQPIISPPASGGVTIYSSTGDSSTYSWYVPD